MTFRFCSETVSCRTKRLRAMEMDVRITPRMTMAAMTSISVSPARALRCEHREYVVQVLFMYIAAHFASHSRK